MTLPHPEPPPAPTLADAAADAALAALVFRTTATGVALLDRELCYVRVNDALAAMNGLAADAHAGRAVRDVIPSAAADALEPLLRRVLETGEPAIDLPLVAESPHGRRHYLSSYHAVAGVDGAPSGIVALVAEYTPDEAALRESLREHEAALRAREAQFETVLRHLPVGVIIAEVPSGRITQVNARARAIWGHAPLPNDVEAYREVEGFHPEDGRPYARDEWPLARAVRSGETVRGEVIEFRRGDGTMGTMRASAAPIADADGRVTTAALVLEDVTALFAAVAAEREARATAERAAQVTSRIAASLADGICMIDAAGRLTYMNPAAERMLGWREDDLRGHVLHDRVHNRRPDGRPYPMHECPLTRVLAAGEPVRGLADQWIRRDGTFVHVVTTSSPIVSEGRVVGAVVSVHDDTERRLVEVEREALLEAAELARAEAEHANRAKAQFLAVMSHELRTPLNAIGGYAELLELGIRGPVTEQQREDLGRIRASQRHLLGLINEVLNYARLETGTVHYDVSRVPVRDALAAAEGLIAPQARAKGLSLHVGAVPADLAARADGDKLRQVVVNLLSNAIKFTDRGGRIELAAEARGDVVAIHVRDTGIGIRADRLEEIFEPFVQVRADLTRTAEGAGLGLAISRDLARGMGGDLTAESALGTGSVFTLTLPAA